MTYEHQKSRKELIHITKVPVGMHINDEAPKNLEKCVWKLSGECKKSMPELYKRCKGTCFAYVSEKNYQK